MPRMLPRSRSKHSCPWTRDFRQRQSNTPPPAKPVVRQSCDQWRQHVGKTPGTVRPAAKTVRDAAKQENLEPQMHTDGPESGGFVHSRNPTTELAQPCRCGGRCPIGVHRCASVVPNFWLASSRAAPRRRSPRSQRASKSPCTRTVHPRPVSAASSGGKTPCTNSRVAWVRGAVMPAGLAAQAKAHAPILSTPAQPAPPLGNVQCAISSKDPLHQFTPLFRQDKAAGAGKTPYT